VEMLPVDEARSARTENRRITDRQRFGPGTAGVVAALDGKAVLADAAREQDRRTLDVRRAARTERRDLVPDVAAVRCAQKPVVEVIPATERVAVLRAGHVQPVEPWARGL